MKTNLKNSLFILIFIMLWSTATCIPVRASSVFSSEMAKLVNRISVTPQGTIINVEPKSIYVDLGEDNRVKEGDIFEVIRFIVKKNSQEKEYTEENNIGIIMLSTVRKNYSIAKTVKLESESNPPKPGDMVFQTKSRIRRIVMTEFSYQGGVNRLSENIYQRLNMLLSDKGYSLVDRSTLQKALKNKELTKSGFFDLTSAQKIGKALGAEAVLVGNISDLRDSVSVNARLVNVDKGEIVSSAFVELDKTPELKAMLNDKLAANTDFGPRLTVGSDHSSSRLNAPSIGAIASTETDNWKLQVLSLTNQGGNMLAKVVFTSKLEGPCTGNVRYNRSTCNGTYVVDQLGTCHQLTKSAIMERHDFYPGVPRMFSMLFKDSGKAEDIHILKIHLEYYFKGGYELQLAVRNIKLK